jgi:hypothetical protein
MLLTFWLHARLPAAQVGRGRRYPTPVASLAGDRQSPRAAKQTGKLAALVERGISACRGRVAENPASRARPDMRTGETRLAVLGTRSKMTLADMIQVTLRRAVGMITEGRYHEDTH